MSIGELFIELGVIGHPEEVEKFDKKIKALAKNMDLTVKNVVKGNNGLANFSKGLKAITTALKTSLFVMAVKTIDNLTQSLIKNNQAMLNLTRTTDIALETFQKWDGIGKMLGVENAGQQLEGLNERIFELMLTGQGARGFQIAGINPVGQDAEGVLEQLRDRVSGMSDTASSYLLREMGLDPKMLHLLRMTREEFSMLQSEIKKYQLTEKQRAQIQKLNIQLAITTQKLKYLKDRVILAILPFWERFIASVSRVAVAFADVSKKTKDILTAFPELKRGFASLGIILGGILAFAHPVISAFVALYLIIDDIATYFQGGDSLFGDFVKYLKSIEDLDTPPLIKDLLALLENVNKFMELQELKKLAKTKEEKEKIEMQEKAMKGAYATKTLMSAKASGFSLPPLLEAMIIGKSAYDINKYEKSKLRENTPSGSESSWNTTETLLKLDVSATDRLQDALQKFSSVMVDDYSILGNKQQLGNRDIMPDLSELFVTPQMQRIVNNSSVSSAVNNNITNSLSPNISITTTQPADAIQQEINRMLSFSRNAMTAGI